ncbi:MAG: methyltransferase domain-containing protein [Acidobacteria bacterium]|nr:methyltransferase domain-containing protein [Acidobacteriota bacterium]
MNTPEDLRPVLDNMRRAWNERAAENAQYYVYTGAPTGEDFDTSGRVNYEQIVRPYLPVLLRGRPPRECRVAEIGCGLGRMTACFAQEFGEVHALDVSTEMLAKARDRLSGFSNVSLYTGSGMDLACLPTAYFDLAFSYIVFQHIPSREAIRNYILEAGRIVRPGGAFHFQLNGYIAPEYQTGEKDTWQGESFSFLEAVEMLRAAGFMPFNAVGAGTQYFVLSARRISSDAQPLSSFILPGQAWPPGQLLEGWSRDIPGDCRPIGVVNRVLLGMPPCERERQSSDRSGLRFFISLNCGPAEGYPTASVMLNERQLGTVPMNGPGDYYGEFPVPGEAVQAPTVVVTLSFNAKQAPAVSVRSLGVYDAACGTLDHTATSEHVFWIANLEQECARLSAEISRANARVAELVAWARSLDEDLNTKVAWARSLDEDLNTKVAWARSLERDVEKAGKDLAQLHTEFEERTAWALSLRDDVEAARNAWANAQQQAQESALRAQQLDTALRAAHENPWPFVVGRIKRALRSLLKR